MTLPPLLLRVLLDTWEYLDTRTNSELSQISTPPPIHNGDLETLSLVVLLYLCSAKYPILSVIANTLMGSAPMPMLVSCPGYSYILKLIIQEHRGEKHWLANNFTARFCLPINPSQWTDQQGLKWERTFSIPIALCRFICRGNEEFVTDFRKTRDRSCALMT